MMRLPYFSRSQLGVAIILGAALSFLWVWRANFFLAPSPPSAADLTRIFVEVRGAAAHPGVLAFEKSPTMAEVWRQAGATGAPPQGELRLSSGGLLEIGRDGSYTLGRMPGARLLTLGLPLDLNTASAADLEALPGVGPALAGRIAAFRRAHWPLQQIDDLLAVEGIGPEKLQKLRPHLALGEAGAGAAAGSEAAAVRPGPAAATGDEDLKSESGRRGKTKAPAQPLNPNLAAAADLETLPGIGPVLARRIVDYRRSHGPFKKIDDLMEVSGIGSKKLAKMKPFLVLTGSSGTGDARR